MSTVQFTRQLGERSGVQLNPLRDQTGLPSTDYRDQIFAAAIRLARGRIDQAFAVDRGNFKLRTGLGESIRANALNEGWAQVSEALDNGAAAAVLSRLVTSSAVVKWATIRLGGGASLTAHVSAGALTTPTIVSGGHGIVSATVFIRGGGGTGGVIALTIVDGTITAATVSSAGSGYATAPTLTVKYTSVTTAFAAGTGTEPDPGTFDIAIKHLGCHNDGIAFELRSDEKPVSGVNAANDIVTLRLRDAQNNIILGPFTGSLTAGATDDYGNSYYLPDVVSNQTDLLEIEVATGSTVQPASDAYGYDSAGRQQWATSGNLAVFDEGGTGYDTGDYTAACDRLRNTNLFYGYVAGGGTQASALLVALGSLAFDTDRQLRFDVPGSYAPAAAITFLQQLGLADNEKGHLIHAYWNPEKATDPSGVNGKGYLGTSAFNIAKSCLRNAQTNAFGYAPKNFPIAGKLWPLTRSNITQTYFPSDQELDALARAKINPVINDTFSNGSYTVFKDSLTLAPVANSKRMLIAVVEMSTDIDARLVAIANDAKQLPMHYAVKQIKRDIEGILKGAAASEWIFPLATSADQDLNAKGYAYTVAPTVDRPYDTVGIEVFANFDGTARRLYVTQTLV